MLRKYWPSLILLLLSSAAAAQEDLDSRSFFVYADISRGDEGNNDLFGWVGDDVNLGDGKYIALGMEWGNETNWKARGSIGIKQDTGNIRGVDYDFHVIPLDILAIYDSGLLEFGAGMTFHINPELDGVFREIGNPDGGVETQLTSTIGLLGQVAVGFEDFNLGARLTLVEYDNNGGLFSVTNLSDTETRFADKLKAHQLSVFMTYSF